MATDLQGIPGAGRNRRRGRRRTSSGRQVPPVLLTDPRRSRAVGRSAGRFGRRAPKAWSPRRAPRQVPWSSLGIAVGFLLLGLFVWREFWSATRVDVRIEGISDGAQLTLEEAVGLDVEIDVAQMDLEAGIEPTLFFDGFEADEGTYEIDETGIRWTPPPLEEGEHELAMSVGRPLLDDAAFSWSFVVDGTAPVIDIVSPQPPVPICQPVTVTGRAETGLAMLTVDGDPLAVDETGAFTLSFDHPPTSPVLLEAEDVAGNRAAAEVVIKVEYPSTQGIHVSAAAWGYEPLRAHVLDLIDQGKISAVEIDIKDESGIIGYDTDVDLAHRVDAVRDLFDLDEAVRTLHDRGVRVIGRIVAFRDGPVARWAIEHDRKDWVIQDNEGNLLSKYGGFTNVANHEVRKYNLDLALEAVDRGVDEILWDYVRRPEGSLEGMYFPGMQIAPGGTEASAVNDTVVSFLAETATPLRERCAYQGASLFGVAAQTPDAIGQPVPAIARHVDYIAPMLYPSHWVRGEYRVDYPNAQPYDIVERALADFQRKAAGSGVAFSLWVQDFSIGVPYGPAEVRAQIEAARDLGIDNWLLWNATVQYTADAITPEMVAR